MNDTRTDQELVAAVRGGDEAAFASLFDRWADRSYDVARRILHDEGRAAEVTQEVFTMAWQQLDTLRDPAAFGGWILRSSRNAALNRRRHEQRAVATDDSSPILRDLDSGRSVEAESDALGHQELVWAASAALGERDASILDLHLRHDLSIPEIADELGVTPNNAHQLVHRMKQRLATGIRAYVLVRGGDASCPTLRVALADAGVTRFGPEAVKVIGTHLKRCDDCEGRQAAVLAPEAMFAAAPIFVMAPLVRAQVAAGLSTAGVPAGGASTSGATGAGGHGAGGQGAAGQGAVGSGGAPPLGGASPTGSGAVGGAIDGDRAAISPEPQAAGGVPRGRGAGALAIGAAAVVVLIVLAAVVLLRNDNDASEDASSGTSTTVVVGGDPEPTATTEPPTRATTTVPSGGDLEGSWTADAADILGANTANVGGPGGLACSGPITMTFTAEGTFSRSGSVTCSIGSTSASGAVASGGGYAVSGDQLSITGTESTGTMSMGATEIPTPDAFGDGDATYEVRGSTLTITFTDPSVGTVTQTYQRS